MRGPHIPVLAVWHNISHWPNSCASNQEHHANQTQVAYDSNSEIPTTIEALMPTLMSPRPLSSSSRYVLAPLHSVHPVRTAPGRVCRTLFCGLFDSHFLRKVYTATFSSHVPPVLPNGASDPEALLLSARSALPTHRQVCSAHRPPQPLLSAVQHVARPESHSSRDVARTQC